VSALAAVAVVATGLAASGAAARATPAAPAAPPAPAEKIKPDLKSKLEAKGSSDFWIRFGEKADLSKASAIKDWTQRGTAVAAELRKTAATSQTGVKAALDAQHVKYQAFWASNAIKVSSGSLAMAQGLASRAEVEGIYSPVTYQVPKTTTGTVEHEVNSIEWGLANINADDVWSQYGDKGAGITVASIDTGVQYDHPALVKQYRGNNGDGTFDHNYNWFDAAGTCGAAPCDTNGHGTHTMGTMVGDDGAGNQVGVAPEVKWIAANGCCPSDTALITSGQWMLEPTNLAGQNPDASKRPNIINNSWGTTLPSNDPFMEDITNAWTASGIFGAFANGNIGPGCQTSGAPGSLASNYSAGAYDINNNIAGFSSRGAGQNGQLKPNISAPGVNVRSSVPGNAYASFNGTSMATPHLAGAVALLWSAAPSLRGDVAATRALLDSSATDQSDTTCGGTAGDNNVFGEGRLDVLALLNAAPTGDTGTLTGKVTAAGTGTAIAGAFVTVTTPGSPVRQLTTGADGRYSSVFTAGTYEITVAAFGYKGQTTSATVTADTTTTKDFSLEAAPSATIDGTVTDGSGHGWPLYAKVSVTGPGGVFDYTTPTNGRYSLQVPSEATYTLKVETQYPGYQTVSQTVQVGADNLTKNIAVPVRTDACTTAPGYKYGSDGLYETFDTTATPAGWTVVDNANNGQVWKFQDVRNRGNMTGAAGGFAIVDSDAYGPGNHQDTSLVSPAVDLTGVAAPVIRFNQDYLALNDKADVDLSVDGGATWATVLQQSASLRGAKEIAIPQAAGKSAVQVRFHYHEASYAWWWEVDSVLIGSAVTCEPVGGGLVLGNVKDANTNGFVNGAVVTSDDKPAESATTVATPEDTGLGDGFYWLYSSVTGQHGFTTKAGSYVTQTKSVQVGADAATAADFTLAAGRLSVSPGALDGTVKMPTGTVTKSFTVTNTGGAPVDVKFTERPGDFEILNADGSKTTRQQVLAGDGAVEQRLQVPTSFAAVESGKTTAPPAPVKPLAAPWTSIANYPSAVMDNRVVNLDGKVYSIAGGDGSASSAQNYVYDPATLAWTSIAPLPDARNAMTVGVVDGKIIASGGWGPSGPDAATWSYDPAANTWTAVAANPAPRSATGQAVLDGALYAIGGCTTSACTPMSNTAVRYDAASNTWTPIANYPKSVAFLACGAIDGKVYCSGGNDGGAALKNGYVYDPGTDGWSAIADSPADHWASSFAVAGGKLTVVGGVQSGAVTNAGFAFDPAAGTWAALPNANTPRYRGAAACGFYKVGGSSGGFAATPDSEALPGLEDCAGAASDVSWLTVDQTETTLAPGAAVTVKVGITANVDQPGKYTAAVGITENTPYTVAPVAVTMNVTPPTTWSKLMGTVTGVNCQGVSAALPGAVVQVDSSVASYTFATGSNGRYAYWMDRRNNPLTIIAAKDGWKPQTRSAKLTASAPTVADFALRPVKC
jgi:subtilisin family serine protease